MLRRIALGTFLVTACGGDVTEPPRPQLEVREPGPPPPERETQTGDVLWAFAVGDGNLRIVGVHLSDASLNPLSFPLSHRLDEVKRAESWRADVVRFELADGRTMLEAEGSRWSTVVEAPPSETLLTHVAFPFVWAERRDRASAALRRIESTVLIRDAVGDSSEHWTEVRPLFEWEATQASGEDAPRWLAFGSPGVLFQKGTNVFLRKVGRTDQVKFITHEAPKVLTTVANERSTVEAVFDASVIMRESPDAVKWLTLDGAPVVVDGFTLSAQGLRGRLQLEGGKLTALHDRRVHFVQRADSIGAIDEIVSTSQGGDPLTLIHDGDRWAVVGQEGTEIASYTPERATPCPSGKEPGRDTSTATVRALNSFEPAVLIRVVHTCGSGDEVEKVGSSLDIWRIDSKTRTSSAKRLRSFTKDESMPAYEFSDSTAYAAAVVNGAIQRIDTRTGMVDTITPGLPLVDWPVHWNDER